MDLVLGWQLDDYPCKAISNAMISSNRLYVSYYDNISIINIRSSISINST